MVAGQYEESTMLDVIMTTFLVIGFGASSAIAITLLLISTGVVK